MTLSASSIESVVHAVNELAGPSSPTEDLWIQKFFQTDEGTSEFLIFLKPDATAVRDGVDVKGVLELLAKSMTKFNVDVGSIRVVRGPFFANTKMMERHYGVINAISRLGRTALTAAADTNLERQFAKQLAEGYRVVGGHQFLEAYPQFTPFALSVLFDSLGNIRLGPGTYGCALKVEGKPYIILNGFHPYQIERFTRSGAVTVLLQAWSHEPWKRLRRELIGATNPVSAEAGSIRANLLLMRDRLGLQEVSQNANGVHMSAGPLEGMVEVRRFFSADGKEDLPVYATAFGRTMRDHGFTAPTIAALQANPIVVTAGGESGSVFDLTEEQDSEEALITLSSIEPSALDAVR